MDQAEALYQQAVQEFQRLRAAEAEAQTRRAWAALLLRRGRPTEATAVMERALEVDPRSGWRGRWVRKLLNALSRRRSR
jgi:tetratricopeptide (TPR) repeat protein